MKPNPVEVGQRIKSIRTNKGLTMEEFGSRLKSSKGIVNNWEKGRNLPNRNRTKKIAELGDLSLHEFLYGPLKDYESMWNELRKAALYIIDENINEPEILVEKILNKMNELEEEI